MTKVQPHSLRWRLVRRLVGLQAAMLALLVLVVIAALWGAGHLIALESEDDTIDALHDAVIRDSNGDISVRDTPTLTHGPADPGTYLAAERVDRLFQGITWVPTSLAPLLG